MCPAGNRNTCVDRSCRSSECTGNSGASSSRSEASSDPCSPYPRCTRMGSRTGRSASRTSGSQRIPIASGRRRDNKTRRGIRGCIVRARISVHRNPRPWCRELKAAADSSRHRAGSGCIVRQCTGEHLYCSPDRSGTSAPDPAPRDRTPRRAEGLAALGHRCNRSPGAASISTQSVSARHDRLRERTTTAETITTDSRRCN
jgi:hypothetical protein